MFTTGYEFTTAATNLFNAAVTAVLAWKMSRSVKPVLRRNLWAVTFLLFFLVCMVGAGVHGIVLTQPQKVQLWQYLYGIMSFMVAAFVTGVVYETDGPASVKRTALITGVLAIVFIVLRNVLEERYRIGFLAFTLYSAGSFLFSFIKLFSVRKKKPYVKYFLAGIISIVIGSILQTVKAIQFHVLIDFDYNAVYHLFTLFLVLLVYKGLKETQKYPAP